VFSSAAALLVNRFEQSGNRGKQPPSIPYPILEKIDGIVSGTTIKWTVYYHPNTGKDLAWHLTSSIDIDRPRRITE